MIRGRLKLNGLHPQVKDAASWCLDVADYYGIPVTVTSGFRSWQEQEELYRKYQQGQSRFPANPPGESSHNYGLSFDSWVPDEWRAAWTWIREYIGFQVPANDWIHAQVPDWRKYV